MTKRSSTFSYDSPEAFEHLHDLQMTSPPHGSIAAQMTKELVPVMGVMVKIAQDKVKQSSEPLETMADVAMAAIMVSRMLLVNVMVNTMPVGVASLFKDQMAEHLSETFVTSVNSAYEALEKDEADDA